MDTAITMNYILTGLGVIVAIAAGIAAIVALYKYITYAHDRAMKWDDTEEQIKEIKAEQCMLTYCMMATLDGLHQLGCNGKVTEARSELDKFMNKQAHGVE